MTVRTLAASILGQTIDPKLCPGCQHQLNTSQTFCPRCLERLARVANACQLCGLENQGNGEICAACLYDPPRWQNLIAPLQYRSLARELLLQLKFGESLYHANNLASTVIKSFVTTRPPEVLLPVPLHHNRFIDRGFNQALEIARILSTQLDIPLDTHMLLRIRDTEAQAGLTANQREKNILKAFSCANTATYRHVAVVDDIVTTGSTANEITKTLHRSGIETVEIWGLARVVKY
jgi:ComF family protein